MHAVEEERTGSAPVAEVASLRREMRAVEEERTRNAPVAEVVS